LNLLGWSALVLATLLFQATFPFPFGMRPDLVLLVACFYGLRKGQARGLGFGALSGLAMDLFSGTLLGPCMLGNGVAAYATGSFPRMFFFRSPFLVAAAVVLVAMAHGVLLNVVLETFLPPGGPRAAALFRNTLVFGVLWLIVERTWGLTENGDHQTS